MKHRFLHALGTLLCLILLLGLFACTAPEPTPDDPQKENTPPTEETVTLVSEGKTSYRIVRSDLLPSGHEVVKSVVALRRAFEEHVGCKIAIATDWEDKDNNADILEIVVGESNRAISALLPDDAPEDAYYIFFEDNKLYIGGANEQATVYAVQHFIDTYLVGATDGTLAVPAALNVVGTFDFKHPTVLYVLHTIKSVSGEEKTTVEYNDVVRLLASLQGRVNKQASKTGVYVYQIFDGFDPFWLDYISEEGKLLEGHTRHDLGSMSEVWAAFGAFITEAGMVLWDPAVPSTANVAATVCAVDGYLPVRYDPSPDSLYSWLRDKGVAVKLDLCDLFDGEFGTSIDDTSIPSTGSIKCDPYLWALDKYGDRVNPNMLAYVLDGATQVAENPVYQKAESTNPDWNQLYSHDYLIYNECFFFDLTCVSDEQPSDDPSQPMGTDATTLVTVLDFFCKKNNGNMAKLMGFPPWYVKYSTHGGNGSLNPTELEFAFTETITQYNFVKEADAAHPSWMTNGSVYTQYEPTVLYTNTESPVEEIFDDNTYYFTIYMGDYDSSAWFKARIPTFFMQDEGRGQYPLMWAFNPNLGDRIPMVFDYVYEHATPNDYFVTGDSGAGYVNPDMLPDIDAWVDYNEPYMQKYDMDIVGFMIHANGLTAREMAAYARFAPIGSFHNDSSQQLIVYNDQTVFMHLMNEIVPSTDDFTPRRMYEYTISNGTNFAAYRAVCKSPTEINGAIEQFIAYAEKQNSSYTYKCVDPYTLFDLVLQSGQGEYIYGE
ncbi:MAG: hypothetical protein IJW97_00275 [Clostridia bacterium]|nr:hypothetical protein [Clostridia bacterium]